MSFNSIQRGSSIAALMHGARSLPASQLQNRELPAPDASGIHFPKVSCNSTVMASCSCHAAAISCGGFLQQ